MIAPQVKQLCVDMGEEVEVRNYERFTSLAVEEGGLRGGYRRVQPGDCVVAFSRKSIFTIKQVLAGSDLGVCLVLHDNDNDNNSMALAMFTPCCCASRPVAVR